MIRLMPTVFVLLDEAGRWPVLVEEDEPLLTGPGARWRFVADVPDRDAGLELVEQLHRQRETGLLDPPRRHAGSDDVGSALAATAPRSQAHT